jgi:8-oxo-dGTP diphosphatase
MDDFFKVDPLTIGSKGLVLIGDKTLVYRRDENTTLFPLFLDLPGGAPEPNETPFDTFKREVKEEFGLNIERQDIIYLRKYPSTLEEGRAAYFPVAQLSEAVADEIEFGDEGLEFLLLPLRDFVNRDDVWPSLKERSNDYLRSLPQ